MRESISAGFKATKEVGGHTLQIYWNLVKVVVPIIVLVKIATELGFINYIAMPLEPAMVLVGLPPIIGLIFATGLIAGINSAVLLYISLLPQLGIMSVADVSVFSVMLLIAHGLPVEGRISAHCGVSFWGHVLLRISAAFSAGYLLRQIYNYTATAQEAAQLLWTPPTHSGLDNPVLAWSMQQVHNLAIMLLLVFVIMLIMRGLKALDLIRHINNALSPLLQVMGIGRNAATITVIGMLAGILYGGGLIKEEVDEGKVSRQDVFSALSLMALAHSIVEDTMVLMLLGADFYGIFWFRILFAMLLTTVIVAISKRFIPIAALPAPPLVPPGELASAGQVMGSLQTPQESERS